MTNIGTEHAPLSRPLRKWGFSSLASHFVQFSSSIPASVCRYPAFMSTSHHQRLSRGSSPAKNLSDNWSIQRWGASSPLMAPADSYCDRFDWGRGQKNMSIATHQPMGHDTAMTGQDRGSLAHTQPCCQMWSLRLQTPTNHISYLDGCHSCIVEWQRHIYDRPTIKLRLICFYLNYSFSVLLVMLLLQADRLTDRHTPDVQSCASPRFKRENQGLSLASVVVIWWSLWSCVQDR